MSEKMNLRIKTKHHAADPEKSRVTQRSYRQRGSLKIWNNFHQLRNSWLFRIWNFDKFQSDTINFIFSEAIEKIDARFDLVMITDRFEESIILMKEMLCMSDDDVIYLALKVNNITVFDYFENRWFRKFSTWFKGPTRDAVYRINHGWRTLVNTNESIPKALWLIIVKSVVSSC